MPKRQRSLPPAYPIAYYVTRAFIRLAFRSLSRLTIEGAEYLPAEGACLIASNHLTELDPPLIYASVRRNLFGLGAFKYKSHPIMGPFMRIARTVFIKRGEVDRQALAMALNVLASGGALLVPVEGTRSRSGALLKGKTGAAYLATRADVPLVPVVTWGAEMVFANVRRFKRGEVHVRFGEPFRLPQGRARTDALEAYTDEIMTTLASMLPEDYRGVYADHPLTLEKLAAAGA